MRTASIFCLSVCGLWVLLAIVDMWFDIMSAEMFIKVTITLGLLSILVLAVALVRREYMDEKQLRKDKYID
ncbi:MAG: hypothetical protein HKN50_09725 [Gammaproteobacteria bacterium]|nr:hypothetical protein [Gammaproteobacteria bacterium]